MAAKKLRARNAAGKAKKDPTPEQENAESLESYERWHKDGGGSDAARAALLYCATNHLAMPDWLAVLVRNAIKASSEGKTDDRLGFGNKKLMTKWRKAWRENRDFIIKHDLLFADQGERTEKKRGLANEFHTSTKNIEKIISPTFKAKK